MAMQSPVMKVIVAVLAIIGALAIFLVIGMLVMHGGMMQMMR